MKLLDLAPVTKERILEVLTEDEIFTKYFIKPELRTKYRNPLRNDNNPDCMFFIGSEGRNKGRLIFYDHAEAKAYDCFSFVMKMFNLSFWEALKKIREDFDLKFSIKYSFKVNEEKKESEKKLEAPKIRPTFKDWQFEIEYWLNLNVSASLLERFNVKLIDTIHINDELRYRSTVTNPIFFYPLSKEEFKTYRPFASKLDKHRNFCKGNCIFGLGQLPMFDDLLIITKSPKDALVLSSFGYNSISLASEGATIKPKLMAELKHRFKKVVVFYDNDGTFEPKKGESGKGKQAALRLSKKHSLPMIFLPGIEKDISDYVDSKGIEEGKSIIKQLLGELEKN